MPMQIIPMPQKAPIPQKPRYQTDLRPSFSNPVRYSMYVMMNSIKDAITLKFKIGLGFSFVFFIFAMFALFVPWYFSFIPGQQVKIWQWTGVAAYDLGTINPWFVMLNTGPGYTPYGTLGFTAINNVMAISLTFLMAAFITNFIVATLYYQRLMGKFNNRKILLGVSLLLVVFLLIAVMQFLQFNAAYAQQVEPGIAVGPGTAFQGVTGGRLWGPGFGWIAAMICLGPAIAMFIVSVVAVGDYE